MVSPIRSMFAGEVVQITAPGVNGSFTILPNHADFISELNPGEVKVITVDGMTQHYAVSGGFLEVRRNEVILLAETAERAEEIDLQRAEASKKRAEERLRQHKADMDSERARLALLRAIARIRVSGKSS